jgi:hypothetical protein
MMQHWRLMVVGVVIAMVGLAASFSVSRSAPSVDRDIRTVCWRASLATPDGMTTRRVMCCELQPDAALRQMTVNWCRGHNETVPTRSLKAKPKGQPL